LTKTILLALFYLLFFLSSAAQTIKNEKLDKLIKGYRELAQDGNGISKQESSYADKIRTFGTEAIPPLIEMLKGNSYEVRDRAAYCLRKIDGLNETHLDDLILAMKNGHTWHAVGIASIGTNKAILALLEQLYIRKTGYDQITFAFKNLKEKGVPYLIDALKCKESCDEIPYNAISRIFRELGEYGALGMSELSKIAFSKDYSIKSRQYAIYCLGHIKQKNSKLENSLNNLAKTDSINFHNSTFRALTKIKSNYALDRFRDALKKAKSESHRRIILRDIAEMGTEAKPLGKVIIQYTKSNDWETRVAAINTLGYLKYKPSLKYIVKALNNEYDYRLNYVAINSIAKMKVKSLL